MKPSEAFDESRPLPQSALDALDLVNTHANTADQYERALREIADADPVDLALDSTWPQRIARAALGEDA
jgi:hypothetical protein